MHYLEPWSSSLKWVSYLQYDKKTNISILFFYNSTKTIFFSVRILIYMSLSLNISFDPLAYT